MVSTVLGTVFPGPGTVYIEQHMRFVAPASATAGSLLVSPTTNGNHVDMSTRGAVGSVGFDAEFAVSSRVRMVPQVRAHLLHNAWRFDPGMSVRVAF